MLRSSDRQVKLQLNGSIPNWNKFKTKSMRGATRFGEVRQKGAMPSVGCAYAKNDI
ncbi:hypothetical protein [Nostoc sp.]|uniref:hypothetical protein n=1 Tax=Nostoc sp. TaxID=1180 RepID=UPI002FF77F24